MVVVVAGKTVLNELSLHGDNRRHQEFAPIWILLKGWTLQVTE